MTNRNKRGEFTKTLKDPVLVQFYAEKHKITWLKLEAKKQKSTLSEIIRRLIDKVRM